MFRINSFLFIKKNIIFQGLPCLPGYLVTLFGDPVFTVIFYLPKADVFARIETQMRNFVIHMSENFVIHMHDSAHSPLHLGGMYTVQYNNIGGQNQSPSGNWSNFGHGASSYVLLKFSPRQLHAIHHASWELCFISSYDQKFVAKATHPRQYSPKSPMSQHHHFPSSKWTGG